MSLRIRHFINGPVESFEDLPFLDRIGSVRRVNSLNKDYICVSLHLYTAYQWLEFDGENIIAPVAPTAGSETGNIALREDGTQSLREDGTTEIREES